MCIHILDPYIEQPTNVKLYSYRFFFTRIQFTNVSTSLRTLRTPWCWVVGCLALLVLPLPKILSCGFLCSHCLQPTGFLPLPPTSPTYLPSLLPTISCALRSWARFLRCESASISSTFTISANNYPTLRFRSLAATQPGWAELCICLLCPRGTDFRHFGLCWVALSEARCIHNVIIWLSNLTRTS